MSETDAGLSELPDGWEVKTLGEITDIFKGGTPKRNVERYFQGDIAWATPTDISNLNGALYIDNTPTHISEEALGKSAARLLPAGTVLLTSRATIGKVAIAKVPIATNQGFANFLCKEEIANVFLAYYLRSITDLLISLAGGTTFLEVTKATLLNVEIPIPPLPEQHRIVAKIEELFTKLDAGINALHKVQAQLKRYRQSVLKAAFEGKLTEAWRAEHQDEIERASPIENDLPDGWAWTTLGEVTEPSKEKVNPLEIKKVPYISLEHIEKDTGKLLGYGSSSDVRSSKTKFKCGDLLYGKLRPYLNKVHISGFEGVCSTDLLVFPKNESFSNAFFLYRFLCRDFVNYASQKVSGVNLPRVNFKTLSQFRIALPPFPEQQAIVSEVERRLSVADDVEKIVTAELKRAERLRQSILKKAFSGGIGAARPKR